MSASRIGDLGALDGKERSANGAQGMPSGHSPWPRSAGDFCESTKRLGVRQPYHILHKLGGAKKISQTEFMKTPAEHDKTPKSSVRNKRSTTTNQTTTTNQHRNRRKVVQGNVNKHNEYVKKGSKRETRAMFREQFAPRHTTRVWQNLSARQRSALRSKALETVEPNPGPLFYTCPQKARCGVAWHYHKKRTDKARNPAEERVKQATREEKKIPLLEKCTKDPKTCPVHLHECKKDQVLPNSFEAEIEQPGRRRKNVPDRKSVV